LLVTPRSTRAAEAVEEVLLVRLAALVGSRDPGRTPVGGILYSRDELAALLADWDPVPDDEEMKRLLQLSELGELVRQVTPLPAQGGSATSSYLLAGSKYDVGVTIFRSERNPDYFEGKLEIWRNGVLVSAPNVSSTFGERVVLSMAAPEDSLFLFYVVEVQRVSGETLRALGLREAWGNPLPNAVASDLVPARPIWGMRARYTDEARRLGIEGAVVLKFRIGTDGKSRDLEVVKPLPAGLTDSALECVRAMRFEPARRRGEPVESEMTLGIGFSLTDDEQR
jgi:TonB family protein